MLLAKLIAMQNGTAPADHLPGWYWLKDKRNG
jgi:hypothetical protein